MARRGSAAGIFMSMAREAVRQQRHAIQEQRRLTREAISAQKQSEKVGRVQYVERRAQEAVELNRKIHENIDALRGVLSQTLEHNDVINFSSLRVYASHPPLVLPTSLKEPASRPVKASFFGHLIRPEGLKAMWPGVKRKFERDLQDAENKFGVAITEWTKQEANRLQALTNAELAYQDQLALFEDGKNLRNAEVDQFEMSYLAGEPNAVVTYNSMVLERSIYPEGFPQIFSVAYMSASKQLVVKYELPTFGIVPDVQEVKYLKSSDSLATKNRKASEVKEIYQDVVASIALRTIHEIFEADQGGHVETFCLNGYIRTVDPATGRDIQPHLLSVRTTKEKFGEIDLARVDKRLCLKNLGAQVSRQPEEAVPIKPIVEFDMADARFIDQTDLVADLSAATNLMDLNPYEFEQLVANLFAKMGLESRLTRSSRDGGVDCVAFDKRPVLGGKVVIQAKRYKNTVGVSAVRDLYGTMMNEGANKGILVTTSGYGSDAFNFASDKPIELIDGGGLLFLLQEIGIEAKILMPPEA